MTAIPTIEQAYKDNEKLIHAVCHNFRRKTGDHRNGGLIYADYDELVGEANALFVMAYRTWDPTKGPLNKRIAYAVWGGLTETWRRTCRRRRVLNQLPLGEGCEVDMVDPPQQESPYADLFRRLDGLSGDALAVADVVFHKRKTRRALTRFLLDLGWAVVRVFEAYKELREALR